MQILATSRENLLIGIDAPADAGDITRYPCEAALIADDGTEPLDGDYYQAQWIGGEVALMVGPGGVAQFPAGDYMAFARITAASERPVLRSGRVRIGGGPP